jgi:hypothetical protein
VEPTVEIIDELDRDDILGSGNRDEAQANDGPTVDKAVFTPAAVGS